MEVDVDAISDGKQVYVAGIMQHIEEAGIHSGDSACSLPPVSIKPFLIFGAGNVPVIVDKTANIKKAAESIVLSKSFDNSTSCSADSVIIVDKNIYSTFIQNLKRNDVYLLNKNEQSKLID